MANKLFFKGFNILSRQETLHKNYSRASHPRQDVCYQNQKPKQNEKPKITSKDVGEEESFSAAGGSQCWYSH